MQRKMKKMNPLKKNRGLKDWPHTKLESKSNSKKESSDKKENKP